jgi:hypothetical protein
VVWYAVLIDALGFSDPLYPVLSVCSVMCFCSGTGMLLLLTCGMLPG